MAWPRVVLRGRGLSRQPKDSFDCNLEVGLQSLWFVYLKSQSLLADDDLYPLEGAEASDAEGTLHHPQSPVLRDRIQLRVSNHRSYEYECPSHTADELRTMSDTMNRMELRGMKDFRFVSDAQSRKILEHVEHFSNAAKSKL